MKRRTKESQRRVKNEREKSGEERGGKKRRDMNGEQKSGEKLIKNVKNEGKILKE